MLEDFLPAAEVERLRGLEVPARLPRGFAADDPEHEVDTIGGAILATAASRFALTDAVRRCARNALDEDMGPGSIRRMILDRIGRADTDPIADIEATVRAALDDVLGPEIEGY